MDKLLILTLLFTLASSTIKGESIPAEQIMTQQEMQAIGIDQMTPEQRSAFENWAGNWTHRVISQAPSYRAGQNLSNWVQNWPSYASPTKSQLSAEDIKLLQQHNQVVFMVRNNGQYIDLQDGSTWQISPFHRYLSTTWQKGQHILEYPGQNSLHPWVLQNVEMNQQAEANMVTPPSPTGQREAESPEYYQGSVALQSVTPLGDIVSLGDGTIWKIAPMDMYKAAKWRPNDRIKVDKSGNFLYNYSLTNLNSGEVCLANQRK